MGLIYDGIKGLTQQKRYEPTQGEEYTTCLMLNMFKVCIFLCIL